MTDDKKPRERTEAEAGPPEAADETTQAAPEKTTGRKAPAREMPAEGAPGEEAPGEAASAQETSAWGKGAWKPGGPADGGRGPGDDRAGTPPTDAEGAAAEARIAELEAEKAELRDQLLRALADVENTRRRLQRELDEKLKYAAAPLAKDLLGVADNLGRALGALPAEAREQEAVKNLTAGVEMTEKALLEAFAKHGIERIDPLGQKLDPHRHEAMMEVQDPSKPAGTVAQVLEAGYELRGRLLRPARVAVAKGGPSAGNGEASEPGSTVDTKA